MKYAKTIVAVGGLVALLGQALADGSISPAEWGELATTAAAAFGVFRVANRL